MAPKGSLRTAVRNFLYGSNNTYNNGDWAVTKGAYDCWFEVNLRGNSFIKCVDGELGGSVYPLQDFGMTYSEAQKYFVKCIKIILDEYPNTSYTEEEC